MDCFLDSDDWWVKDKLKVCLNSLNNKIDLIYHDLEIVDSSSNSFLRKKFKGRLLSKPILKDLLVGAIKEGNAIGNSSVIVRKNILTKIGGINENRNLVASEDYNTWLRIAEVTDEFKYLKKNLVIILYTMLVHKKICLYLINKLFSILWIFTLVNKNLI